MNLKQFLIALALAIGLGNSMMMLWTFYNIYITDGHFVRAEVFVGEPAMWILIPEIAITIFGVIFLSLILFRNHGSNIRRISI